MDSEDSQRGVTSDSCFLFENVPICIAKKHTIGPPPTNNSIHKHVPVELPFVGACPSGAQGTP